MNKNVFVFVEQRDGNIEKVSYELIGKAKELAGDLGQKVFAIFLGYDIKDKAKPLIEHGADEVIVIDDKLLKEYSTEPYTKALCKVIHEEKPEIVLIGASAIGRDLAPRVSARIHTGLTADCTKLAIDPESKNLLMTRPAFGGNIMATIVCEDFRPQMATVRPGVMEALDKDTTRSGNIRETVVDFVPSDMNIKIREVIKSTKKQVDITKSKILVSGGRGVGSKEGFALLKQLADVLGAEISCSRAAVDAGWIEAERQVGQTGKTVRPNVYIACGISGAIQHVAGMEDSDFIIAINKNNTAPIFNIADVGIVGDIQVILPKLTEEIKKLLNK